MDGLISAAYLVFGGGLRADHVLLEVWVGWVGGWVSK